MSDLLRLSSVMWLRRGVMLLAAGVTLPALLAACTIEIPEDPRGPWRDAQDDTDDADAEPSDTPGDVPSVPDDAVDDTRADTELPPDPVLLAQVVEEVFLASCAPCHTDRVTAELSLRPRPSLARALAAPAAQQRDMPRILPGDPDGSYLWHKILGTHEDVGGRGQQMPLGGQLTQGQLMLLERWILDGALE